jgi:phosphonate transport system substrate-binding protein
VWDWRKDFVDGGVFVTAIVRLRKVPILAALALLAACLVVVGCGGSQAGMQGGSADSSGSGGEEGRLERIRLVIGDVQGEANLQREYGPFQEELSRALGTEVEFYPVPNLAAGTAALEAGRADLVLAGPAEYVSMRARADAVPVAGLSRPDYYSVIAVHRDSGIESVEDLRGEEIVMEQPLGTSTHLGPCKILQDAGLDCESDVELVLLQEKGTATNAFAQREVPAIGTNADRYASMLEDAELSEEEAPIIAEGPQLPPDVFMTRRDVPEEERRRIREAMLDNEEALISAILEGGEENQKFEGSEFIEVDDSDFDYMREAYRAVGVDDFAGLLEE